MSQRALRKGLGFWDSVAINVGIVIGVGIFRTPGGIAHYVDSAPLILLTWALGGLVALLGVFCYAELSSCLPRTGGTYIYLREAFGKPLGFLFGWAEFSVLRAGSIAGVAYILVDYLGNFLPAASGHEKFFAVLAIFLFTWVNILGLHIGTRVQNVLTFLKILAILMVSGIVFARLGFLPEGAMQSFSSIRWEHVRGMAPALIPVLWTYGGWHQSTFLSADFADTKRALPRSLIMGVVIVAGLYLLMNAAYLRVLTPAETAGTRAIASDVLGRLFGDPGRAAVTLVVLISASGALNSTVLTGGRIPFAVAGDYPKLSWFAKLDPRFSTPVRSLLANAVWASVLVLWGNFDQLLFFFAFTNWFFFALTGVSVFILRKRSFQKEGEEKTFSMAGYPWVPVLFILSCVTLCFITIQTAPRESLFGAALLLLGVPIYAFIRK